MSFVTVCLILIISCNVQISLQQDPIQDDCPSGEGCDCTYENVALKGRATQSSVYGNSDHGYVSWPVNAIDGNKDSDYNHGSCTHTNAEDNPWWRVDLLRDYHIVYIKITNRGDCCGDRLIGAEILVGNSLQNNGNDNTRCAVINAITDGQTQTYECKNMVGRYVNIVLRKKQAFLHFCEVEILGVPTYKDNFCYS
ncbi:fucolectin-like [Discoglossus pictus]